LGVLVLDSHSPEFFTSEILSLVENVSEIIVETTRGTQLLHFSKIKTRNLHTLFEISNALSALLGIEEIMGTSLAAAKEIISCDSAAVAVLEDDGKTFKLKSWSGNPGLPENMVFPRDELFQWLLRNKKPIRFNRGQGQGAFARFPENGKGELSEMSFLVVPLLAGEEGLGLIRLNSLAGKFQVYDQDILTTIANQTAMALENALMVQKIHDLAVRDGLTGAFNHRYFQEKLGDELSRAERYHKQLTIILLDVDHFKKFNDTYGNQAGDHVLRKIAEIIQGTVRKKIDSVCRYGGEEFAVILPECAVADGLALAERILKNIGGHLFEHEGQKVYRATASIGLSGYPLDAKNTAELIKAADEALYAAKREGRNRAFHGSRL